MDAGWPTEAARVPEGLSPERAWRWCVLRTIRDGRLAVARGQWVSRRNLERLFCRRWWNMAVSLPGAEIAPNAARRRAGWGRTWIRYSLFNQSIKEQQ